MKLANGRLALILAVTESYKVLLINLDRHRHFHSQQNYFQLNDPTNAIFGILNYSKIIFDKTTPITDKQTLDFEKYFLDKINYFRISGCFWAF